jgi:HEAT repeat protein
MDWLTGSRSGEAKRLISQLGDPTQRDRAAKELIRMGEAAVPSLLEALQTRDVSLVPLYEQILARIPAAAPALIKSLTTAHPLARGRAAEVFAISKDRSAVPTLLEALESEYFTVRARAALALGKIGDRRAVQPLLGALRDGEDDVRAGACLGLGFFRDPSTFDDIANLLLDDPRIEVRRAAARALGDTGHPAALPFLLEALHDSSWWYEREYAAGDLLLALEKMGTASVEPLIEALGDREGTVRKFAAMLLGRLGAPHAIEPLCMALYDLHHEVGKAAAEALTHFGSQAVDVLAAAHPETWIRIHAVQGLAGIRDGRGAPVLLPMLNDPERDVRKQAIQALGDLKDPRALPALQQIAGNRADRELHLLARQALEGFARS